MTKETNERLDTLLENLEGLLKQIADTNERAAAALEKIAAGMNTEPEDDGSGFYTRNGEEITESEIADKMTQLESTGEYDGFSETELRKIAIELIQDDDCPF